MPTPTSRSLRVARSVEVEWQFAVSDLVAFRRWLVGAELTGWTVAPAAVLRLSDVYFDTIGWRVWKAGYALRLRREGRKVEATLKAVTRSRRGVARRREISSATRGAGMVALLAAPGGVGALLRTIVGAERPRRLFAVRTRREVFAVRHEERVVAELALDRTRLVAGARARALSRVEVEVKAGAPARVARFVATLRRGRHLTPARRSKYEEGLATARLHPPRC